MGNLGGIFMMDMDIFEGMVVGAGASVGNVSVR